MYIPNCVPDYFLEQREREEREYELEERRYEGYQKAKEYIANKRNEGCAVFTFPPYECYSCEHGEEAPVTFDGDDIPEIICSNCRNCKLFRKHMEELWPDDSWETIISWYVKGE